MAQFSIEISLRFGQAIGLFTASNCWHRFEGNQQPQNYRATPYRTYVAVQFKTFEDDFLIESKNVMLTASKLPILEVYTAQNDDHKRCSIAFRNAGK